MAVIKAEDIVIGQVYYVTSSYDCKNCYRVRAEEILSATSVRVTSFSRGKKHKKKPPKTFSLPISALHKSESKAVHGYKQHHK